MNMARSQVPVVSVVTPFFDADDTIPDAVRSVLRQSFADWELILVDDNHEDMTSGPDVLSPFRDDPRIQILKTDGNVGAGPARNFGIDAAQGRYIAFLDADDMWCPQKLAIQIAAMQTENSVLSCTGYVRVNVTTGQRTVVGVPAQICRATLLRTNLIACSSAIFDRSHFEQKHMPPLRRRQDFAFWLMLLEDGSNVLGVSEPLMTYHERPNSLSASRRDSARDTWFMYRRHLGLPLVQAAYYFGHYAIRGVARRFAPQTARLIGWIHP